MRMLILPQVTAILEYTAGQLSEEKKVVAFMLLSTIQSAFLIRAIANDVLDFDLVPTRAFILFQLCDRPAFTPESAHDQTRR